MTDPANDRTAHMRRQLVLFVTGIVGLGVAAGIFETTFNNYLDDTFRIGAATRGLIEFPRELPGFLTALFAGLLFFLAETRIAVACAAAVGIGMCGLSAMGDHWGWMLGFMLLWSSGVHMMMPVQASVGMAMARRDGHGARLGQLTAAHTAAALIGCSAVVVLLRFLDLGYASTYLAGGLAALLAAVAFSLMRMPDAHLRRPKFIWRRQYWLYYVLALLFGARKQLFITFGPWVLIKLFDQEAYVFAQLWMVSALLGLGFHPALGRLIDRIGERRVLMADSLLVLVVCAGYGFADAIPRQVAVWMLYICYVGDHLLFGVNMARQTYMAKIADDRSHVAPTLSLGVSINHAISMTVPIIGGFLWTAFGHSAVFIACAGIAGLMFVFSAQIRLPAPQPNP